MKRETDTQMRLSEKIDAEMGDNDSTGMEKDHNTFTYQFLNHKVSREATKKMLIPLEIFFIYTTL